MTPSASRSEPCIAEHVLPNASFRFVDDIDLMDETLREGAERATVPPTLEAKADLAEAIARTGIRSIVVGMFPDVPHNIAFLKELVERQSAGRIAKHVRFLVISHVGITFRQTLDTLNSLSIPLSSVWIIAIHSVSDLQIRHLFPTILRKDSALVWDDDAWSRTSDAEMRRFNLQWFDEFLPSLAGYQGGGVMVGLLDAFRANHEHLVAAVQTVARHPVTQIRLVDTAGTCLPHQVHRTVGELVSDFPRIQFFGHFHDDFGMATGNAITGLSLGLKGVDVSVGGFANRAGHPPLAEVTMALRKLYGVALPGFRYDQLTQLSRLTERLYGLMENPAQAVTGVITHSVQSGIRTELLRRAPTIFDILDPSEIGADLVRMFGVRSGRDGLLRFLRETGVLEPLGMAPSAEIADRLYPALEQEWQRRSAQAHERLQSCIRDYHNALNHSFFTEHDVLAWLEANISKLNSTKGTCMTLAATQADLRATAPALHRNLWTAFQGIAATSSEREWDALLELAAWTAEQAFSVETPADLRFDAELQVHRTLYRIYAGRVAAPWNDGWTDLDNYRFDQLRHVLESAWAHAESGRFVDAFGPLPPLDRFPAWAQEKCRQDRSNVSHPLFAFLRDEASFEQLREFIVQETPFDIHFGDILAMMMPGVYGGAKMEFSKNFWDEMGRGELASMHRQLRQRMTQQMDVDDNVYIADIERFRVEELRLANMYFHAVFNRALLPQAIGMMLATELMVPGRLDQQIAGWRRVGLKDDSMRYLLEHTVVDVEHANGWMHEVVLPMLERRPDLMADVVAGMARRLAYAGEVCDGMMAFLPTLEARAAYA